MAAAVRVFVPRNLIPLQQAVLCANCEVVSDSKNGRCVVCGSPSLLNLACVLDGSNHRVERTRPWGRRVRAAACDSASNRG
ncbi:MAG TPA: hypothetical protein VJN48_17915 [Terriglobales bacterium]|nr:hypothetical protein [Terriglobales bacterium]